MTCKKSDSAYYLVDDALSSEDRREFEKHLLDCEECRELVSMLRSMEPRLSETLSNRSSAPTQGLSDRVAAAVFSGNKAPLIQRLFLRFGRVAAVFLVLATAGGLYGIFGKSDLFQVSDEKSTSANNGETKTKPSPEESSLPRVVPQERIASTEDTTSGNGAISVQRTNDGEDDELLKLPLVRDEIAAALYACSEEEDDLLLPVFEMRMEKLRKEGWPVETHVSRMTRHENLLVSKTALRILGRTARPADLYVVARCLRDERLSSVAVEALGRFRVSGAVDQLASWMSEAEDPSLVLKSLAAIGSVEAEETLYRFAADRLESNDRRPEESREEDLIVAMTALGSMGTSALDSLVSLYELGAPKEPLVENIRRLEDVEAEVIAAIKGDRSGGRSVLTLDQALHVMGLLRLEGAVSALRSFSQSTDLPSRGLWALVEIGGAEAAELLAQLSEGKSSRYTHTALVSIVKDLEKDEEDFEALLTNLTQVEIRRLVLGLHEDKGLRSGECLLAIARVIVSPEMRVEILLALGEVDIPQLRPQLDAYLVESEEPLVRAAALLSAYRLTPRDPGLTPSGGYSARLKSLVSRAVRRWRDGGRFPAPSTVRRISQSLRSS